MLVQKTCTTVLLKGIKLTDLLFCQLPNTFVEIFLKCMLGCVVVVYHILVISETNMRVSGVYINTQIFYFFPSALLGLFTGFV